MISQAMFGRTRLRASSEVASAMISVRVMRAMMISLVRSGCLRDTQSHGMRSGVNRSASRACRALLGDAVTVVRHPYRHAPHVAVGEPKREPGTRPERRAHFGPHL